MLLVINAWSLITRILRMRSRKNMRQGWRNQE